MKKNPTSVVECKFSVLLWVTLVEQHYAKYAHLVDELHVVAIRRNIININMHMADNLDEHNQVISDFKKALNDVAKL